MLVGGDKFTVAHIFMMMLQVPLVHCSDTNTTLSANDLDNGKRRKFFWTPSAQVHPGKF